jgi:hypothetical protein
MVKSPFGYWNPYLLLSLARRKSHGHNPRACLRAALAAKSSRCLLPPADFLSDGTATA